MTFERFGHTSRILNKYIQWGFQSHYLLIITVLAVFFKLSFHNIVFSISAW